MVDVVFWLLAAITISGAIAVALWALVTGFREDRAMWREYRTEARWRRIRQLERDLGFIDPPWVSDPSRPIPEPGPNRPIWR